MFCPQLTVTGFDYGRSAGALQVRCEVLVRGCICQLKKCSVMEEIVVDEQKPVEREDDCSLTIYYADSGENLWEIAKAYHTAMQSVLEANSQLELSQEDAVSKREMLLIPILSNLLFCHAAPKRRSEANAWKAATSIQTSPGAPAATSTSGSSGRCGPESPPLSNGLWRIW